MCAGCDPESYTWPDVSTDGGAAFRESLERGLNQAAAGKIRERPDLLEPSPYDWMTVEIPFDWINPKWRGTP